MRKAIRKSRRERQIKKWLRKGIVKEKKKNKEA